MRAGAVLQGAGRQVGAEQAITTSFRVSVEPAGVRRRIRSSQQASENRRKLTAKKAVPPSGPSAQPLYFGSPHGSCGSPTVLSG